MNKHKLYREFTHLSDRDVRSITIRIVSENRKLPRNIARWKRNLQIKEVEKIREELGGTKEKTN